MAKPKREYCVYTVPPGQTPARLMKCFKTKKAAKRFMRRERYTQIITRARPFAGRRHVKRRRK